MTSADTAERASPGENSAAPARRLSLFDTTCIMVGIVIGSSIFVSLPKIAWNLVGPSHEAYGWFVAITNGPRGLSLVEAQQHAAQGAAGAEYELVAGAGLRFSWALGGVLAMIGALCFAELATAYPQDGGMYVYLSRAFGRWCGLAFVWLEFLLIRPGNIGAVAFVASKYMQKLVPLPDFYFLPPETWWALAIVLGVTLVNFLGFTLEKWMQNGLTLAKVFGIAVIVLIAWYWPVPAGYTVPPNPDWQSAFGEQSFAVAMTFIMFAYGGWSDMVYVAAEVREPKKNLFRALVLGVVAVTAIYLLVVDSLLFALPFRGIRNGDVVAAELMEALLKESPNWQVIAKRCVSALIVVSCVGSIHGMLFTSSRAFFAAGREHRLVGWFGKWSSRLGVPLRALLSQGLLTVFLIVVFGLVQDGFEKLVVFTGPFFFGFFALTALSVIVLRGDKKTERPYLVPFYPITPIVFGVTSLWLCYGTTRYLIATLSGWQWIWAAIVVVSAIVALCLDRRAPEPIVAKEKPAQA